MNDNVLDWKRIDSAVRQMAQELSLTANAEEVCRQLRELAEICGPFTSNRKMLVKIGRVLLNGSREIIVPICAEYFSELVKSHIKFWGNILTVIPQFKQFEMLLLVGGRGENNNQKLFQVAKQTHELLKMMIEQCPSDVHLIIQKQSWHVQIMAEIIPDLKERELKTFQEILSNPNLKTRIDTETIERMEMYQREYGKTISDMRTATILGAAQYVILGKYATEQNALICNHNTGRLAWYSQTGAGVLHNPKSNQHNPKLNLDEL